MSGQLLASQTSASTARLAELVDERKAIASGILKSSPNRKTDHTLIGRTVNALAECGHFDVVVVDTLNPGYPKEIMGNRGDFIVPKLIRKADECLRRIAGIGRIEYALGLCEAA